MAHRFPPTEEGVQHLERETQLMPMTRRNRALRAKPTFAAGQSEATQLLQGLRGESPEVVLSRIFDGDPIDLQAVVMRVLRRNGLLLDPDRCLQHSLEEVAYVVGHMEPNDPELIDKVWIEQCAERSCDRLLREDEEAESLWEMGLPAPQGTHRFLSEAFGVDWGMGRTASVGFHHLPLRARLSFFAVCVERVQAEQWMEQTETDQEELRRDLWDVFNALGYVNAEEVEEFRARV